MTRPLTGHARCSTGAQHLTAQRDPLTAPSIAQPAATDGPVSIHITTGEDGAPAVARSSCA